MINSTAIGLVILTPQRINSIKPRGGAREMKPYAMAWINHQFSLGMDKIGREKMQQAIAQAKGE